MNKQTQDLLWASLTKADRRVFRKTYATNLANSLDYCQERAIVLNWVFGKHNLTSDTEPEEMLMTSKVEVTELYKRALNEDFVISGGARLQLSRGIRFALKKLFGDKCLPDKESSVQVEPKFNERDKVRFKDSYYKEELHGKVGIIVSVNAELECYVKVDNTVYCAKESDLEPYPEPETKMTEERYQYLNSLSIEEYDKETSSAEQTAFCDYQQKYHPDEVVYWQTHSNDTPETKDNMEERELNLAELLKGRVGEWFYVTPCGEMELKEINKLELKPLHFSRDAINCLTKTDGRAYENGSCIIYPSRTLYEKYPLDAKKAWEVWTSERKPKRWRAEKGEEYLFIDTDGILWRAKEEKSFLDDKRHRFGNYFKDEQTAQQAAEAVRKTLNKFQEYLSQSK